MNLHKKRKAVIAKQLDEQHGKITLTVEQWSCQYTSSYLKISAQYINPDWKLINRAIGFRLLPEPIDENFIVECITNVLEDWKLINKTNFNPGRSRLQPHSLDNQSPSNPLLLSLATEREACITNKISTRLITYSSGLPKTVPGSSVNSTHPKPPPVTRPVL
ncbi:hypothetical protein PtA15_1A541 [Puccinia triticina]|uniref:Uncharacterized protein n=1 Tax=Puccinia triticina TaxID=208348 RepID=A0ABY7C7Q4_9BASI|nr:uncharacterized protein PtA15_1A541 [Puccinia triticina]WAQ81201.1 hypothetical protein PtA15_1A541 [Puccinia triticina]